MQEFPSLRVAFAHQSVGQNILDGLGELCSGSASPLRIAETRVPFAEPGIHHFRIGRNTDPALKIADFRAAMATLGPSTDVALLKLCYVDLNEEVEPEQLAQQYLHALDELQGQFPDATFIPATMPLTTIQAGPRAWAKKVLGRKPDGQDANIRRGLFNRVVRQSCGCDRLLFDIAAMESCSSRKIESLDPRLTDDGGHLNALGRRLAAKALLEVLEGAQQRRIAREGIRSTA